MNLNDYYHYHIVVVGCGGTGSNLIPHLCQWANSLKRQAMISITLADGDRVEPNNIGRQFFVENDLGKNKADVLQARYYAAWGTDVSSYNEYIRDEDTLIKLLEPPECHTNHKTLPILVGCVDNHFSRQIMSRVFKKMRTLAYIDGGNSEFAGQVVIGFKRAGKTYLKPVANRFPEILETVDEIEEGGTCTAKIVKQPQNIMANIFSAMSILGFLNNLVAFKNLPVCMVTFNGHNLVIRPEYIEK